MRSTALPSWVFRALLLTVNVVGIWWVHHDLVGAALPGLRVLAALPGRDVDATDRFTLVFDRPLSLPGSPGDVHLARNPFTIAPQVAGQWFWAAPEKLEYRLDKPLPPGRRFRLSASPSAEQMLGRKLLGLAEFEFRTRPLEVASCLITSADGENANVEVAFNQPVDPADLLRHLILTDGDSTDRLETQVLNKAPDSTLLIRTSRPKSDKLSLKLDARLTGAGAELPLNGEYGQQLEVKSAFAVLNVDVEPAALSPNSSAKIRFTKDLDADKTRELQQSVQITPPVEGLLVRVHEYEREMLILSGPFKSGQTYTARLAADIASANGEKLGREAVLSLVVPDRRPTIQFQARGGILSQHGNLLIDMKHVNVPTISLQAGRVHANNLAFHLRREARDATSREFPSKTVQLDAIHNVPDNAAVDLRKLLGEPLGIYWIRAAGESGTWAGHSTVVAITDLAITTKQERSGLLVWVTSLSTARPVAGAEVSALTYNNQTIARATSDGSGIARLEIPTAHPDGPAWLITAQLGEDTSYIEPQERPWVLDDIDQSGRKSPTTYDVMLYAERGVYRPGDTVHLTGIIRDAAGAVPPAFPLTMTVRRPDGKEIAQLPISPATNSQGIFQIDYATPDVGQTGPYLFRVSVPGSKESLGEVDALVEEYAPQRMELQTTCGGLFGPDEAVEFEAAARYLFDQPAAGLPVRVSGTYNRQVFRSQRFTEFAFTPTDPDAEEPIAEQKIDLDDEGRATVSVAAPQNATPNLWRAELNVTVSEQGGRSVSRRVETRVDTASRHVGVRLPAGRLVPMGAAVEVEWVQVTGTDEPATRGPAAYTLTRVDRDTVVQEVDRRYVWKTIERTTELTHAELAAPDGEVGRFTINCPDTGVHRLAITDSESGAVTQIEFQATADMNGPLVSTDGSPDRITLTLDREHYAPGSTARISVEAPFTGTMLLTVETDRIVDTRIAELTEPTTQIDVPVDAALRGGAFITATVVRRIDPTDQKWLPHRAMGMVRLRTDHAAHRIDVTIDAPEKALPGQTIPIRVVTASADVTTASANVTTAPADATASTMVHIWAVDEGILLTSDFTTPDPNTHFFAPRQAEIVSADVFGDLMPDHERPAGMTRIGGDGGDEEEYRRRLKPVALPRHAPAVIWRAVAPVQADGSLVAEMTMPELTGKLRIMAVAIDGDLYGSAALPLVLTTPLLVEISCPRFAAPDDVIELPIKILNCTDADLDVSVDLSASGPIRLEALPQEPIRIPANQPVVVWTRATATGIGSVSMIARANAATAGGEAIGGKQLATFGVRPAGPLHSETQIVATTAGELFRIPTDGKWLPATTKTTICIGPRPTVQLQSAVEELIEYPYGCVEQTTSRLYVLLHVPELLASPAQSSEIRPAGSRSHTDLDAGSGPNAGSSSRSEAVGGMIDAGMARLWSMQTRSGGLGYWPGDPHPCPWGSIYAAEFITAAERQGYTAGEAFVSELAKYLEGLITAELSKDIDENLRAQLCYVLARMNRPQQSWMNRLSETPDKLDIAGRAYLAGAWIELGRKDRATALLSDDAFSRSVPMAQTSRPTSRVHQDSVLLSVLMDLDPHHRLIPSLVQKLEKARTNGHWGSTLENAAAMAALARYQLAGTEPASFDGIIRQGDMSRPFDHAATQTFTLSADKPIEITSSGQGRIYLSVTTEGLLAKAVPQDYDHNLLVARRWLNRAGEPVDPSGLSVGDLVVVEITLAAPNAHEGEAVDNIAVVDALPGGLEVENPRLAGSEESDELGSDTSDRVEFRDDRVVIFSSAGRTQRTFRYALRAITAGAYVAPPIQASCMYDGSTASIHGGGRVVIAK